MTWYAIAGLVVLGLVVLAILLGAVRLRVLMRGIRDVRAAHPGELVIATGLMEAEGWSAAQRVPVIAVVANADGLSFRDRADHEVLMVPSDEILSLELSPLNPRSRTRPVRVERLSGGPVAFLAGSTPDEQVEAIIALRSTLGRAAG